jgi:regulator of nonsense transcripts 2
MEQIEKELKELEDQSSSEADINPINEEQNELINYEEDETGQNTNLSAITNSNNASSSNLASTANTNNLANANMKILMDAYIAQLPNCVNRELIDKAAKEFLTNMNTKTNRKRLVSALFQVQRTRLDLLPFYSRFVAILNPFMPELSTDLSSLLLNDFRFHVRKKDQINIESKIKTARFIGELVKFKMFGKTEAVNCLKTLLADFRHHNIEMFCNLLDCAGRYLYRNQETHMKLRLLLVIFL